MLFYANYKQKILGNTVSTTTANSDSFVYFFQVEAEEVLVAENHEVHQEDVVVQEVENQVDSRVEKL